MTAPSVDVAVVTWNTAELTVTALRRLLDTPQGCPIRLLVRDNASGDGTAEAIAAGVPEAELDAGEENVGFAAGVNRLLARSAAPYVLLLNSDAWPAPCAIGRLVAAAERHPTAAAVAPRLERPSGELEHSTHALPSVGLAAALALGGERALGRARAERMLLHGAWRHDRAREVGWAVGAALLLRRAAIDDVGGFDESLFMYGEDLDWCWRARRRGWTIRFEPSAVVLHVGDASGRQAFAGTRTATHLRNAYRVYRRERGALSTAAYRGLNVAGSALRLAGARAARDEGRAAWWREQVRGHLGRP